MKIKYFQETDTLYLAFSDGEITETRELDENTLLDYDGQGNISEENEPLRSRGTHSVSGPIRV